jgi:hypothetical protein
MEVVIGLMMVALGIAVLAVISFLVEHHTEEYEQEMLRKLDK